MDLGQIVTVNGERCKIIRQLGPGRYQAATLPRGEYRTIVDLAETFHATPHQIRLKQTYKARLNSSGHTPGGAQDTEWYVA